MAGGDRRKDMNWRETESMSDAASRLLRVLDERSKKRKALAGGDAGAGTNCLSKDACPCVSLEKSGLADRNNGPHAIDASLQLTPSEGRNGGDPVASKGFSGNGLVMGVGRADLSGGSFSLRCKDTVRPTLEEPLLTDRANKHAPED